jgi:hypothetical protein
MRQFILGLAVLFAFGASGRAQEAEVSITGGLASFSNSKFGNLTANGDPQGELTADNGFRIGARLSLNSWEFLGHEISYAYQRSGLNIGGADSGGMAIQNYYYNFVVHATPQGSPVRPFATAGIGVSTYFPPGTSSFSGNGLNSFGYNYGGGLKFPIGPIFGLRFDVRDHVTGNPFGDFVQSSSGRIHNIEYSAGFSLLF